jgi:hypothetical protein
MTLKMEKRRDFLVVLFSGADEASHLALKKLGERTSGEIRSFAIVNCAEINEIWIDPTSTVFASGASLDSGLIDWLANNLGQLETIRLVGLVSGDQEMETLNLIDKSMRKLKDILLTMSVNLTMLEYRVACPTYTSSIPKVPFFTQSATSNLVVVARDSSTHKSISKPVDGLGTVSFASHIAIELSAILGMWNEIVHPIVDELKIIQTGVPEVHVRFVSSHVNVLDCPPLPINKVMSQGGELPLPHHFFSVPDANQASQIFSNLIYPQDLRFAATEPPVGPLVSVEGKKLRKPYLKELLGAFIQTPAALFRGVQDHLGAMSGAALQEAVGGSRSSVEVMYPGRKVDMGDVIVTPEQINRVVNEVSERADRPVISTIGANAWVQVVEKILAVADGGSPSNEERKEYADEKYLLVRQSALSPDANDLPELLRQIYEGPDVNMASNQEAVEHPSETAVLVDVDDLNDSDLPETDPTLVVLQDNQDEKTHLDSVDALEHASLVGDEVNFELSSETEIIEEQLLKPKRDDLLGKITQIMLEESEASRSRAEQMVGYLRELPGKFTASEVGTISNSVKYAVGLGLSVMYFAIGALTGRRNWFNFEFLGDKNKSLAWVLITTVLVFAAVSGIVIRNNEKWQGKVIAAATTLVVLLGLEFVFWNSIWTLVMKIQRFRGGPLAAALLLIAALVVVAISITRNRLSESKVRKQFASALLVFSWIYVVIGATAAMGSDQSAIWSKGNIAGEVWTESRISGLRNVSLAAGLTLLIVSGFVVAFTIVRERYKLEELSRHFVWAVEELEISTDAERRLRLAAAQWAGTAAVLARLFRYPLGRNVLDEEIEAKTSTSNLSALKFEQQNLLLTRKGEQGLTARLRQLFIAKGWLSRQYKQLISRFQLDLAFEQGVGISETKGMRPEHCPAVPTFKEILAGEARGSRWTFMKNVFGGQYDSALLETTNEVQLEAAYGTIVDDSESHSVGDSGLIAPDFFERLVPSEPVRLPNGLVTSLFAANDSRQLMIPYVWWPSELLSKPQTKREVNFRESMVLTPSKVTDPIRLLGSCVMLSESFVLDEVGMGEGFFNLQNALNDEPLQVNEQLPRGEV